MLDLNTSLSSSEMLHHSLNPLHKTLNLNAESCFPLGFNHSEYCDEAGNALAYHRTNDSSLAPKLKEMISTEHSSITASSVLTPSDLGLLVDCEASSKHVNQHNEPIFEHNYLNPSNNMHKSRADYGDYRLIRDDHKPLHEHHGLNPHQGSDSRLIVDDCKLSLEGDSSSNDGKSLPLESTGSVISTNGMIEEKQFTSSLKDVLYPHNHGVPSSRNIAEPLYGVCMHSVTSASAAAAHAYDSSVEEDVAEPGDHITRQLFPLRPSSNENGVQGPTSNVFNHGNIIKPIINTNYECLGATTSVSSNVLNNNIINATLECIGASNIAVRPPWSFPSSPHITLPSMSLINPITHGIQPVKKSRRGPRSRSSQYRGVTFYRRTGRWESHIWDCGKQVYLGGFDTALAAARAYDRAAIRFRGLDADINFNLGDYESEINQMNSVSKEEFVHLLRRQSMGFARGSSKFRGVTLHKCGRWEARMGQFLGKKAYDEAAIQCNGREAITNFDTRIYNKDLLKESMCDTPSAVHEDDLELSLGGTSLRRQRSLPNEEARSLIMKHPRYNSTSPTLQGSTMSGSPWLQQQGPINIMGQAGNGTQQILEGSYNSSRQLYKHSFLDNQSLPQTGLVSEANSSFKLFKSAMESTNEQQVNPITRLEPPPLPPPPLAAGGWAWQMQQNVCAAAALSSASSPAPASTLSLMQAAAASSGFSPQQGFAFPQWLHKTGLSYISTSANNPSH